jgi:hypothetical protein
MSAAELQGGVRVDCRTSEVRDALGKRKTTAEVRRRAGSLAETLGLARAEVQIA